MAKAHRRKSGASYTRGRNPVKRRKGSRSMSRSTPGPSWQRDLAGALFQAAAAFYAGGMSAGLGAPAMLCSTFSGPIAAAGVASAFGVAYHPMLAGMVAGGAVDITRPTYGGGGGATGDWGGPYGGGGGATGGWPPYGGGGGATGSW